MINSDYYSIEFETFIKILAGLIWLTIEIAGNGLLIMLAYWHCDDQYKTLIHMLQMQAISGDLIHNLISITLATARYLLSSCLFIHSVQVNAHFQFNVIYRVLIEKAYTLSLN